MVKSACPVGFRCRVSQPNLHNHHCICKNIMVIHVRPVFALKNQPLKCVQHFSQSSNQTNTRDVPSFPMILLAKNYRNLLFHPFPLYFSIFPIGFPRFFQPRRLPVPFPNNGRRSDGHFGIAIRQAEAREIQDPSLVARLSICWGNHHL